LAEKEYYRRLALSRSFKEAVAATACFFWYFSTDAGKMDASNYFTFLIKNKKTNLYLLLVHCSPVPRLFASMLTK
jgi:hypothetical protein